jgi:sulfhydrogenase subunit beta (sulfur reductase)
MKLKLDKKDFRSFLQGLIETYDLFASVQLAEGVSVYRKIDHPEEVDLMHPNPQKPAKDLFFPQSEVMFRYDKVGKQTSILPLDEGKRERVLFGARPCDIEALSILEKVFVGE